MVGKGALAMISSPPAVISNDISDLGVIVDRSIFDDDVELTIPLDLPMTIDEERSLAESVVTDEGGGGGVRLMKNGKVRRKLRWKPPHFRRNQNKNNAPSDQSVVSALTARSTATNRSTSTTKSFLSHFSRKSQNSFHTFHSTATPVVKNSKQSQHTFERPNYNDTFDYGMAGPLTIANEGRNVLNTITQSSTGTIVDPQLRPIPADPDHSMAAISPMTQTSLQFFDPFGESDTPVTTVPDVIGLGSAPPSPPSGPRPPKARRPPLFKRKLKLGKSKSSVMSEESNNSPNPMALVKADSTLSAEGLGIDTPPTIASSTSPLSEAISMERQESLLPSLDVDDFEDDRRVALSAQIFRRSDPGRQSFHADSHDDKDSVQGMKSINVKPSNSSMETSTTVGSAASGSKVSSRKVRVSVVVHPVSNTNSATPRKYNRPVDTTISSSNSRNSEDSCNGRSPKQKRSSAPVDVDEVEFIEAENNLRAIHDMAAEHLAHGEYEEATEVFEEILRGQEARYGSSSFRVGTALHNLGIVHMKNGKHDKAIEVCQKAVSVRKEALAPNHPDVAVSLAQLGVAQLEIQNFEESLASFQEALHIRRNHLGPRHPRCAKILNNLGCAFYSLRRYEEALDAFEEALDIQRDSLRTLSEDAQDKTIPHSTSTLLSIASTLCNLGSIMSKQGHFDDAEHALEEALLVSYLFPVHIDEPLTIFSFFCLFPFQPRQIQQSVLPDDHPTILTTFESMEVVSNMKGSTIPSAAALLSRWSRRSRVGVGHGSSVLCTQPMLADVLNLDAITSLSPQSWLEQVGDAIAETAGCGVAHQEKDAEVVHKENRISSAGQS